MAMITKRIDLNAGYSCNIRCRFCYYQETVCIKKGKKDLSTDEVKHWLAYFRSKGLEEVDLTGGEPTIRRDIAELARYSRSIGYRTVAVITNGLRMADASFCEELVTAGVNDVLFSIHGPDADIHDRLTATPGSFDRVMQAVENIRSLSRRYPVRYRSNSTINGVNYRQVPQMAELLSGKDFSVSNFIMFNPIVEAQSSNSDMNVSYAEAAPYLKEMVDRYRGKLKKINIRYMPFCLMQGYEPFITNTPQIQYDPDEWDYYFRTRFRNGPFLWLGALGLGLLLHPAKKRWPLIGWNRYKHEALKWSLAFANKVKGPQCGQCAYRRICDGLWRDYAKKKGFGELSPVAGAPVDDPCAFMEKR